MLKEQTVISYIPRVELSLNVNVVMRRIYFDLLLKDHPVLQTHFTEVCNEIKLRWRLAYFFINYMIWLHFTVIFPRYVHKQCGFLHT